MSLKTINAAAKELGVHWQIAKSLYQRLGYLKWLNGRYQIEVEFKLLKGAALRLEV
ncbi:MAG: hypothetical protein ABJM65_09600 [Ascidiaceihabitans sp.]|uniref:hypothetical protein n=1 Tax=Ascidiaceihabitans sp. TaxID=1872644 RepID=UPI003297FFC9